MAYKDKDYQKKYYLLNKSEYAERSRKYYLNNKSIVLQKQKINYELNRDSELEYSKKHYQKNKLKRLEQCKQYAEKNKSKRTEYINNYMKTKRSSDLNFKLKDNIRRRINGALRNNWKSKSSIKLIGCSVDSLKGYLQNLFDAGMNWGNYGEWEIDHIIPCSKFDLSNEEQQYKCFHYTNLQPLWKHDNRSKFNN